MPSQAHQSNLVQQREGLAGPESDAFARPHHPPAIRLVQVDWCIKLLCPLNQGSIEMRVRDGNGFQAAPLLNCCYSVAIQVANTIPQHIALICLEQQGALPDSERGLRTYTGEMRFVFFEYIMKIACLQSGKRCPLLSLIPNVLAFIGTNRACLRGCFALSKLGSTRGANPVVHHGFSFHQSVSVCQELPPSVLYTTLG